MLEGLVVLLLGDFAEAFGILANPEAFPCLQRQLPVLLLIHEGLEDFLSRRAELQQGIAHRPITPLGVGALAAIAKLGVKIPQAVGDFRTKRLGLREMVLQDDAQRRGRAVGNGGIFVLQRADEQLRRFRAVTDVAQGLRRSEANEPIGVMQPRENTGSKLLSVMKTSERMAVDRTSGFACFDAASARTSRGSGEMRGIV